ncbi:MULTISPECIES: nucleoside-diphosphate kinase [Kitasatospora]|uniref:Nucleoside diphosphate kinase-like domain-containing protein n=1 Tax=Kitasatospora cystarginea TaxID=58350 RepID=A0ABP5QHV8_9ACTN
MPESSPADLDRRTTVPAAALEALTADRSKRDHYRLDTYAREGLRLFGALGALDRLAEYTFVVLKPDAVAGRRCALVLDTLAEEGFRPVAAAPVRFDPLLTREIWRYQFNAASDQRIAVVDHLLGSGPSLVVLLRDAHRDATPDHQRLPASVRLTALKGAADPNAARGQDLRTRIGRVNGLFNFVHTADDPADLVRELRLFCYRTGSQWLAEGLGRPLPDAAAPDNPAKELLPQLEEQIPAHDLDLAAALRRLAERADGWGRLATGHADRAQVAAWLDALRELELPDGTARWDVLTVVTGWIDCNAPDVTPILATARPADWLPATAPEVALA